MPEDAEGVGYRQQQQQQQQQQEQHYHNYYHKEKLAQQMQQVIAKLASTSQELAELKAQVARLERHNKWKAFAICVCCCRAE
jgi:ferric-dicitrate binding protein FerR (iron transport regulator)